MVAFSAVVRLIQCGFYPVVKFISIDFVLFKF